LVFAWPTLIDWFLYFILGLETIDWNFELGLCEKCADKKAGNYHAWNHRQWVLQKSANLLNFELIKTEKFIRKNVSDYSCYHHRNVVLMKLFEFCFYDLDELNVENLIKYVNDVLQGDRVFENLNDLIAYLIPNVRAETISPNKLNCFLYCLNIAFNDIRLCNELYQIYGKYEAFSCYKRITIKFIVDIIRIVNQTNYLLAACNNTLTVQDQMRQEVSPHTDIAFLKFLPSFFQIDEKYSNIFLKIH
jgi:protein prenyltransferase alpha subunit repeat containing protein 1